jgi:anionic cell wall polymer biosynthesis LytR-Cps2A-Psr (LCP) family protein
MTDLIGKIKQITGEEINYYANIDFSGFKKIIDAL